MTDENREELVTSKDILMITSISRATLNNYIKLGLLPRPLVRKPFGDRVDTTKIGYFPRASVDTIRKVKELKDEGFSMEAIVARLRTTPSSPQETVPPFLSSGDHEVRKGPSALPLFPDDPASSSGSLRPESAGDRFQIPSLLSCSVLDLTFQNLDHLEDELLPDRFFSILERVFKAAVAAAAKYDGMPQWEGEGLSIYFPEGGKNPHVLNAFRTALEVQAASRQILADLKSSLNLFGDFHVNIGLSTGQEFLARFRRPSTRIFSSPGRTQAEARILSRQGRDGSIWAVKTLICQLTALEQNLFRFGVLRDGQFSEGIFSRVANHDGVHDVGGSPVGARLIAAKIAVDTV